MVPWACHVRNSAAMQHTNQLCGSPGLKTEGSSQLKLTFCMAWCGIHSTVPAGMCRWPASVMSAATSRSWPTPMAACNRSQCT